MGTDDEEKSRLLGNVQDSINDESKARTRWITLEPSLVLYMAYLLPYSTISNQYIYQRFKENYNISDLYLHQDNGTDSKCGADSNSSFHHQEQLAQRDASNFNMILNVSSSLVSIFVVFIYGSLSDNFGRRLPFFLTSTGAMLRVSIVVLIVAFHLPLYLMIVAGLIDSIFGGFTAYLMAAFSYIADISSLEKRAIRITIVEAIFGLSNAASQIALGFALRDIGFLYTFVVILGVLVLNVIFVLFFLPESRNAPRGFELSAMSQRVRKTFQLWTSRDRETRIPMILILASLLLFCCSTFGVTIGQGLFFLDSPLCWSPVLLGYHSAASSCIIHIGQTTMVALLVKKITEFGVAGIGCVSAVSSLCLLAFSKETWMVFLATAIGFSGVVPIPMIRSVLSKMGSPEEQGAMFANVAAMESLANLMDGFLVNALYSATVFVWNGMTFVVLAGVNLTGMILLLCYHLYKKRQSKTLYTSL